MAQVVLENVYKSFPRRQGGKVARPADEAIAADQTDLISAESASVLRRIYLSIADGEFMVLVGPSGCGKSTLLRLIAGLESVTGGSIWVGDRLVNDLPPKQRDIAMVFQSYALYPHLTVYDNLAFGLRRADQTNDQAEKGQAEKGQAEKGQAEKGQAEKGQAEKGQAEKGQAEKGQAEKGQAEKGQAEKGQAEKGQAEKGQAEKGQAEKGQAEKGQAEKGQAEKGQAEKGQAEKGQAEKGQAEKGQAEKGQAEKGQAEKGQAEKGQAEKGQQSRATSTLPAWANRSLVALTRPLPRGLQYWSSEEKAIARRVAAVAQMLQIDHLLDRLPKQLSGGQKQRVALGRAIARNPQVFLMDEPLSNLDAKLRNETRTQIVNLQRTLGITTIYVTHDQTEAMTMGDRIAVMNAGQIQQIAAPLELYSQPANRFVAEFIGSPPMNFLSVQVKAPLLIQHPQFRLTLPESWEAALKPYDGRSLTLGIRPEHLSVSLPAPKNIAVKVDRIEALGSQTYLTVSLTDTEANSTEAPFAHLQALQIQIEPDRPIHLGEILWLSIAVDKIHLFDPDTTLRIA